MTELRKYRAVVEMRAYSFEEAVEELRRDGYDVKALEEREEADG